MLIISLFMDDGSEWFALYGQIFELYCGLFVFHEILFTLSGICLFSQFKTFFFSFNFANDLPLAVIIGNIFDIVANIRFAFRAMRELNHSWDIPRFFIL